MADPKTPPKTIRQGKLTGTLLMTDPMPIYILSNGLFCAEIAGIWVRRNSVQRLKSAIPNIPFIKKLKVFYEPYNRKPNNQEKMRTSEIGGVRQRKARSLYGSSPQFALVDGNLTWHDTLYVHTPQLEKEMNKLYADQFAFDKKHYAKLDALMKKARKVTIENAEKIIEKEGVPIK